MDCCYEYILLSGLHFEWNISIYFIIYTLYSTLRWCLIFKWKFIFPSLVTSTNIDQREESCTQEQGNLYIVASMKTNYIRQKRLWSGGSEERETTFWLLLLPGRREPGVVTAIRVSLWANTETTNLGHDTINVWQIL